MKPTGVPTIVLVIATALAVSACGGSRAGQQARSQASVRVLPCGESIGGQPPERGMTVLFGEVALPASPRMRHALQTGPSGSHDPAARLFAKEGLVIRGSADFQLIVPRGLRGRLSIGWGNANEGHLGTTIIGHPCARGQRDGWLNFAGGYWVRRPICAPLTVAARGRRRRVWIGIGTACPGQLPPPQPTQS